MVREKGWKNLLCEVIECIEQIEDGGGRIGWVKLKLQPELEALCHSVALIQVAITSIAPTCTKYI